MVHLSNIPYPLTNRIMLYLGADVSTKEIVLARSDNESHRVLPNTSAAIKAFLQKGNFDPQTTVMGCEATGDCQTLFCLSALKEGFPVKVINPILTRQIINSTVRKKKTDLSDARIITKLLEDGHGISVTAKDFQQQKRTIIRTEHRIVHCQGQLKVILGTLKEKAKVMDLTETIQSVERCIETLGCESKKMVEDFTEEQNPQEILLDSVPGCGEKLAAIISAEAGDIRRFPSSSQFKAYVGIDPKVTQSGNYMHTGHITKRGNSHLRYALYLAANIARQHDYIFKAFYDKKRSEGKSHRHAVCAVSRKLCECIFAMIKKNELYRIRNPY